MSVRQFDTVHDVVLDGVALKGVAAFTCEHFVPRGGTALYDAVAFAVIGLGKKLKDLPEAERPEHVIVVVYTDGEENASVEYRHAPERIKALIKHQEDVYKWRFVFLGANIDAVAIGASLGMHGINYQADAAGMQASYAVVSATVGSTRMGDASAVADVQLLSNVSGAAADDLVRSFKSAKARRSKSKM